MYFYMNSVFKFYLLILLTISVNVFCSNFQITTSHEPNITRINVTCTNDSQESSRKRRALDSPVNKNEIFASAGSKIQDNQRKKLSFVNDDKLDLERLYKYHNKSNDEGHHHKPHGRKDKVKHTPNNDLFKLSKDNHWPQVYIRVSCENFSFESVPKNINSDVQHLEIESTGNLFFNPNWGANFSKLAYIKVNSNVGLKIPQDCTWLPLSAQNVDLSFSPIENLQIVNCPQQLKILNIEGMQIKNITICQKSLEELDVSWNLLSEDNIYTPCINGTSNVLTLRLHNNQLSEWSSCSWPSLHILILHHNRFKKINFTNCQPKHLLYLDLSNNYLQEIPTKLPHRLRIIKLSHNSINKTSHISKDVENLDLSRNLIRFISKGTFRHAKNLQVLDLSYNRLDSIYGHDLRGLVSLYSLDLSHNEIQHVRHEAFKGLAELTTLKLNNNNIHQLHSHVLTSLPEHVEISLHHNPWRCSCHLLELLDKATEGHYKKTGHTPKLTCYEDSKKIPAENILQQCKEARHHLKTDSPVHFITTPKESDEDLSDELSDDEDERDNSRKAFHNQWAIGVTVVLVLVPFVGFGIRTLYIKRRNLKKWCWCDKETSPYTSQLAERQNEESDSETEF